MNLFNLYATLTLDDSSMVTGLDNAQTEAASFGTKFNASMTKANDGANKVIKGVGGIVTAVGAMVGTNIEATENAARLETAFEGAGKTAEQAAEQYKDMYAIIGDDGQTTEAAAHLAELTNNQEELDKWTEITAGVVGKFGDSLPIESLTEAANETAKVGEVTGSMADALNWAGVSEDEFNEKLAAANSEQDRAALITETLNDLYADEAAAYRENNEELIAQREAQAQLTEAISGVTTAVMPMITFFTQLAADILPKVISFVTENKEVLMLLATAIGVAVAAVKAWALGQAALNLVLSLNPIGLLIAAIVGLVAGFAILWNTNEDFRNFWIEVWDNITGKIGTFKDFFVESVGKIKDEAFAIFDNIADKIGTFKDGFVEICGEVKDFFGETFNSFVDLAKVPLNAVIGLLNGVISGVNFVIEALNSIQVSIPDWVPGFGGSSYGINLPYAKQIAYLAKGGTLFSGSAVVGEAGAELLTVANGQTRVTPLTGTQGASAFDGLATQITNALLPLINAISPTQEAVVQLDGTTIAKAMFEPLEKEKKRRGVK